MPKRLFGLGALLVWTIIGYTTELEAAPIHEAAMAGDTKRVGQLLDDGVDVNAADAVGTPLHWALFANQSEMVRLLLSAGADPNVEGAIACAGCKSHLYSRS